MDRELKIHTITNRLKELNFKKKGLNFHYNNEIFHLIINVQKSLYSKDDFYINLGLDCNCKNLESECLIRKRYTDFSCKFGGANPDVNMFLDNIEQELLNCTSVSALRQSDIIEGADIVIFNITDYTKDIEWLKSIAVNNYKITNYHVMTEYSPDELTIKVEEHKIINEAFKYKIDDSLLNSSATLNYIKNNVLDKIPNELSLKEKREYAQKELKKIFLVNENGYFPQNINSWPFSNGRPLKYKGKKKIEGLFYSAFIEKDTDKHLYIAEIFKDNGYSIILVNDIKNPDNIDYVI
jgi:hypothetical protein